MQFEAAEENILSNESHWMVFQNSAQIWKRNEKEKPFTGSLILTVVLSLAYIRTLSE